MERAEEKEMKNYLITVCMVHSVLSNHIVKHEIKAITDDIKEVMVDITDTMNESKFININSTILKCDSIDNVTYKEI